MLRKGEKWRIIKKDHNSSISNVIDSDNSWIFLNKTFKREKNQEETKENIETEEKAEKEFKKLQKKHEKSI